MGSKVASLDRWLCPSIFDTCITAGATAWKCRLARLIKAGVESSGGRRGVKGEPSISLYPLHTLL